MFELDIRHYCATLLHPKYRQLKGCTNNEREQTYDYVREQMKRITNKSKQKSSSQDDSSILKKQKIQHSILQHYEDDDQDDEINHRDDSSGSEDYPYRAPPPDELTRYLAMVIDKKKLSSNPLNFWKENQDMFPVLSSLARQIHCIPASSSAVERCFSSAGFIINERRTSLHPDQLDNIIVVRAMKKYEKKV